MELKDVLHFYIGCECIVSNKIDSVVCKVINISYNGTGAYCSGKTKDGRLFNYYGISNIKPILRPLSDMTEEEIYECVSLSYYPNEDVFKSTISYIKRRVEQKMNVKFGTSIPYDGFKSDGTPFMIATLSSRSLNPQQMMYLLKKSFDLFNLIESGQAIDKTKLNP